MTTGRPLPVNARVFVTAFYKDVARVTSRKAQRSVPHVRSHQAAAEPNVAWAEVEAVLWRTRPFTRSLVMAIFCSVEEVKSTTRKKERI